MDVQEFLDLTQRVQEAVQQHNRPGLESLVAPGFQLITTRYDNPLTREQWLDAATGPFHVRDFAASDFRVTQAGDVAIVVYRYSQDASMGDRPAARDWLTTDLWRRTDGAWQLLARQAEILAP